MPSTERWTRSDGDTSATNIVVASPGHHQGRAGVGPRADGETEDGQPSALQHAGRGPGSWHREQEPARRGDGQPQCVTEDGGERRSVGVGCTLQLEEDRHRRPRVLGQRLVPPVPAEDGSEPRAGVGLQGVAEAPLEQIAVGALHQRSDPRSRSRRAMMFRWISEVPP